MKKKLLLAACASVCVPCALAQSSVTLYGSLGDSIAYSNNENGKSVWFLGGGTTPEWIGFTGTEDLGGGLKAVFKLEQGIITATGSGLIAGDMFSRQAWVGLADEHYGRLSFGRQFDITNEMLMPLSNGYQTSIYQLYHPANLDDYGSTFYSNAVKWTSPLMAGFTVEDMYGFDDTGAQPGRYAGAGVSYRNGPLKAALVYSAQHDRTLALNAKLGYTSFDNEPIAPNGPFVARSVQIAAGNVTYALTGRWSVRAGYSQAQVEARNGASSSMRTGEAGVNFQTVPWNLVSAGAYYASFGGAHYVATGISDVYSLSKSVALFASIAYQHTSGANAAMANLLPSSTHAQVVSFMGTQLFF